MCHVVNSSASHRVRDSHILYGVRGNSLNDIRGISKEMSCCSAVAVYCGVFRFVRTVQPTADMVAQNPEIVPKNFQFSTRRTRILMGSDGIYHYYHAMRWY